MNKAERIVNMMGELYASASITGAVEKVQAILDETEPHEPTPAQGCDCPMCEGVETEENKLDSTESKHFVNRQEKP